jgi:hypothetical protein
MRIALQCYGGTRCVLRHGHLTNFIQTFPEIFKEENDLDIFILTTQNDKRSTNQQIEESVQHLRECFGDRLKKIIYYEDLPTEIHQKEEEIYETWEKLETKKVLTEEEIQQYQHELSGGIDQLFLKRHPFYPHTDMQTHLRKNQTLTFDKDEFVPRYYYRRQILNTIRHEYIDEEHAYETAETKTRKAYDWVIMARMFDMTYEKMRPLDFLIGPPEEQTVYASIDNIVMGSPETMDAIFAPFSQKYPVVGYEQWSEPRFMQTYRQYEMYWSYLRHLTTYCSENQLLWQCLQNCQKFVNLRCGNGNMGLIPSPDAYFLPIFCESRGR